MRIGIDFDNTIVCYDALFHRLAVERNLLPPGPVISKSTVRDDLRSRGLEAQWTQMQAEAYGPRIGEAHAFEGVRDFLAGCRRERIAVHIVSHKTRNPYLGERHNLHTAAYGWLARNRFFAGDGGLSPDDVFFEETKEAKLARIAALRCDLFVDDLPEILLHPSFPAAVRRVLFDPDGDRPPDASIQVMRSWPDAASLLLDRVMS